MFKSTVLALSSIGRSFIGGFGTRVNRGTSSRGIGPYSEAILREHPGSVLKQLGRRTFRGNRWMAHLGTKERARHAGAADGRMDKSAERMAEMSAARSTVIAKPARKSRAKKVAA